jgi:hypothetical protein
MPRPAPHLLRRLLFASLIRNLASVLGVAQVAVAHWCVTVLVGRPAGAPLAWVAAALALGAANALAVPSIVRARRRGDRAGAFARFYMELGVATLFVSLAVAASWILYAALGGGARLLGADPAWLASAFRALSGIGVLAVAGWMAWGFTLGQRRVDVTTTRVGLPKLHPGLAGLRLVQISDLHIGNGLERERLDRMVERTNATRPDLIVLTGDLFDFDPVQLPDGARRLGRLCARHGVYAILGNHDRYVGAERVADALAEHAPGIRLLRDELVRLPTDEPLYLAGVEDRGECWYGRSLRFDAIDVLARQRPDDGPVVLLVHQPEAFVQAAGHGFPLVLAGHTHGGQVALPIQRGQLNLARVMTPLVRGSYRRDDSLLYVNRGLGVGGPALRIHCNREIAVLELEPA